MITKKLGAEKSTDFYPTPEKLAAKILEGVDWNKINTVLEPSAGKGDLVKAVKEAVAKEFWGRTDSVDIDCIELDDNLQHILRGNGFRVVADDFLAFHTHKEYDLMLMNPPFSQGAKHLLKAIQMQSRYGGNIICLLNAETIRNPFTNERRELKTALDKYQAQIEYVEDAFASAERTADVDVAIVKIFIPKVERRSDIYEKMVKAYEYREEMRNVYDLTLSDYIDNAIAQFNVETAAGVELIKEYERMCPYILLSFGEEGINNVPLLDLCVNGHSYSKASVNEYLRATRLKYWKAVTV